MPCFTLTDVARDLWIDSFAVHAADLDQLNVVPWSVAKRTLRGGRRDGVDLIRVDNGRLSFSVVPTRGMGLWRGHYQGDRLGWRSPVLDGPVHPRLVNQETWGGLGWLDGFDELMVRCGLGHNGPPYREGDRTYTLHGKIANLPAHFVAVQIDEAPPHAITIEGQVDEAHLFGVQVRLTTRITTFPGSNRLIVRDELTPLGDSPVQAMLLYHWNFGPPYLDEGARLVAPIKTLVPQTAYAAEGVGRFDVYDAPTPGCPEQVYHTELHGEGPDGRTLALLRNQAGDRAVVLRFAKSQLPCFTLWKRTGGLNEGYVTGLEPATNYPNPSPFERSQGRFAALKPGQSYVAETTLEVLDTPSEVSAAESEVHALQRLGAPTLHPRPVGPFVPEP